MDEEKKTLYFYLNLCKIGLLLIGLSAIRALSIHHDALSFILGLSGFIFVGIHIKFLENKWGISKRSSLLSTGIFAVVFFPLAYWFAYPL